MDIIKVESHKITQVGKNLKFKIQLFGFEKPLWLEWPAVKSEAKVLEYLDQLQNRPKAFEPLVNKWPEVIIALQAWKRAKAEAEEPAGEAEAEEPQEEAEEAREPSWEPEGLTWEPAWEPEEAPREPEEPPREPEEPREEAEGPSRPKRARKAPARLLE